MQEVSGLTREEIVSWLRKGEYPVYRADQILDWIYRKLEFDFEKMTNISSDLRKALAATFALPTLNLKTIKPSTDDETIKFIWELADGKFVESVLIMSGERRTICVSSQVGCNARCSFCASGKKGLVRNLSAAEIVEQFLLINRYLAEKGEALSHVVFMGMGEPLENFDNVIKAVRILTDEKMGALGQRRITISTVGVVEGIYKLQDEQLKVNLVLSLHAPNQKIRRRIIPYARKYELEEVLTAIRNYAKVTKRDITYEYTLLAGINDQKEHAVELAELVKKDQCTINLIPYNPVEGLTLSRPNKEAIEMFRHELFARGVRSTQRYTKGKDIAAACGQLALLTEESVFSAAAPSPLALVK